MNHWPKCINIWYVTSFGHSLIKEYIWQNQVNDTGPLGFLYPYVDPGRGEHPAHATQNDPELRFLTTTFCSSPLKILKNHIAPL